MREDLSEILVIQDRSGSMSGVWNSAVAGFNGFIEGQKAVEGEARFSAVFFDTNQIDYCEPGTPMEEVELLSATNLRYGPLGGTALLDALGTSIISLRDRIDRLPEDEQPGVVIIMINTDGEENSSSNYTHKQVEELVRTLQEDRNWQFIFMSANLDAMKDAVNNLGFTRNQTLAYTPDSLSNRVSYGVISGAAASLRTSGGFSTGMAGNSMGNWTNEGINWNPEHAARSLDETEDSSGSAGSS